MVVGVAVTLLVALGSLPGPAHAQVKPATGRLKAEPIEVSVRRLSGFQRTNSEKRTFGKLTWRGGLVLSSPARNFGGWSGLAVDADGQRFVSVSDAGVWIAGTLTYDEKGLLKGVDGVRLGPILARNGAAVRGRDRDAEGITLLDGTLAQGTVLVAFEQNHRIGVYDVGSAGLGALRSYLPMPPEARQMPRNGALEAVAVVKAGRYRGTVVAMAERFKDKAGNNTGWMWIGGKPQQFGLTRPGDWDVTDMAGLPDGGFVVLERRFGWLEGIRMRLRRVKASEVRPGAIWEAEELLTADLTDEIDNMEGIAVHRDKRGETVLTLISDDNYNTLLQRTVMLQFTLAGDGVAESKPAQAPAKR